ncbi:uncharacterized protein [Coffea arabica]|uniref:Uncharacterized protein n=1 Tax=Coffea arabica TaxID=13443 RepID=A0A6P6UZD8_COFAR|nr:uncharacterized protein LOC113716092 [Coffea arabica]
MADDEIVSLVKQVDKLVIILHKLLNIKTLQAKLVIEKIGEVIGVLEMEGPPTLPDQLEKDIATLALPIGDFVQRTELLNSSSNGEYMMNIHQCWGRKLSSEVRELVEQIGLNENKLEKFLDESDYYNSWKDLRHNLALLPYRVAVRDLLQSCRELRDAVNFFHEVGTESAFLCQHLKFLLSFAELGERSNEWRCRQFVKGIRDVANEALGALNCADKYSRYVMAKYYQTDRCASAKCVPAHSSHLRMVKTTISSDDDEQAKRFFYGKHGKRFVLLETLRLLHSFAVEIDTTGGKLGREDPQSHNASSGRNGFPSLSMIREKFAREDLPSLPSTYYLRAFPLIEARKRRRVSSSDTRPDKQVNYLRAFRGKRRVISIRSGDNSECVWIVSYLKYFYCSTFCDVMYVR